MGMNIWTYSDGAVSKHRTETVDSSNSGMIRMHIHSPIVEKQKSSYEQNVKLKFSMRNHFNNATHDNATPLLRHLSM